MKWISVKEQLPEVGQRVLFYSLDEQVNDSVDLCEFVVNPDRSLSIPGFVWYAPGTEQYLSIDVLYWMPLPNQPERSKREDSQECEMRCSEHCGNTVSPK